MPLVEFRYRAGRLHFLSNSVIISRFKRYNTRVRGRLPKQAILAACYLTSTPTRPVSSRAFIFRANLSSRGLLDNTQDVCLTYVPASHFLFLDAIPTLSSREGS